MTVALVVEGDTDLPIVRKLVADARLEVWTEIDCGGKDALDASLRDYNNAAQGFPWFVLRDLDHDAPCAAAFLVACGLAPSRWMSFRVAVRELEAWLLADAQGLADFLGVSVTAVPGDPDAQEDPTVCIVNLARRSRRPAIKRAMVPSDGARTSVGPLYEAKIIEFGERHWNLERAVLRSDSLRRARLRIRELAQRWAVYIEGGE